MVLSGLVEQVSVLQLLCHSLLCSGGVLDVVMVGANLFNECLQHEMKSRQGLQVGFS